MSTVAHKETGINSDNQKLAKELKSHLLENFKKRKEYSLFKNNIWGADLVHI